jgi:hypothetical protein
MNTFLSSYSKMRNTNGVLASNRGMGDPLKEIAELDASDSETKTMKKDDDDDINRTEEDERIDLT